MLGGVWDIHSLHGRRRKRGANSERRSNSNPTHTNTLVRKNCIRVTAARYSSAAPSDSLPTPQPRAGFQQDDAARKHRELVRVELFGYSTETGHWGDERRPQNRWTSASGSLFFSSSL